MKREQVARGSALALLAGLLVIGLLSDWLAGGAGHSAFELQAQLSSAARHDVLRWWVLATRNVLSVSATATLLGALLGSALGALAIYGGSGLTGALSRLVGFTGAFPGLLLVGLFRLVDPSRGVLALLVALSLLRTLEVAQLVRAELSSALLGEYVEASRALGASRRWQLRAHVVPRVARPLLANVLQGACGLVGLEAALSLVGLGLPVAVPSWGGGLAVVGAAGRSGVLSLASASIGLTCAALYWLGAHLAAARPPSGGTPPVPLVELGAVKSGS